jgi:hypothetical protein
MVLLFIETKKNLFPKIQTAENFGWAKGTIIFESNMLHMYVTVLCCHVGPIPKLWAGEGEMKSSQRHTVGKVG